MKSTIEIIHSLNQILESPTSKRAEFVKAFQDEIWNDESIQDFVLNEILLELAYDLDFYESNEEWKNESPNYYGEERLEELIKLGIQKVEEYRNAQQ